MEKDPLLGPETGSDEAPAAEVTEIHVYKRRWYILFLFSYFSLTQALTWNTWAPISGPAEVVFNWTDGHITTMNNLGCVGTLIPSLFYTWFIVAKGYRYAMLLNGAALFIGSGIRCISPDATVMTITAMLGAFLTGGASLAGAGSAVTSSLWFPVNERFTATSIGVSSWYIGFAASFLLGPYIVKDRFLNQTYNASDIHQSEIEIMDLMYIEAGMAAVLMILLLIYFPAKPPKPPSPSATAPRYNFLQAVKSLSGNLTYWRVLAAFVLTCGIYSSWASIIDVNMKTIHIPQDTAGWMGFWGVVALVTGSSASGRINDYFKKQVKTSILILLTVSAAMFLWFALMFQAVIEPTIVSIYAAVIVAALSIGGCLPLFFELMCENAYPTPEAIASGVQNAVANAAAVIFYLVFLIPGIGTSWMNWVMFGVVLPTSVLMATFKPTYSRLTTDIMNREQQAV